MRSKKFLFIFLIGIFLFQIKSFSVEAIEGKSKAELSKKALIAMFPEMSNEAIINLLTTNGFCSLFAKAFAMNFLDQLDSNNEAELQKIIEGLGDAKKSFQNEIKITKNDIEKNNNSGPVTINELNSLVTDLQTRIFIISHKQLKLEKKKEMIASQKERSFNAEMVEGQVSEGNEVEKDTNFDRRNKIRGLGSQTDNICYLLGLEKLDDNTYNFFKYWIENYEAFNAYEFINFILYRKYGDLLQDCREVYEDGSYKTITYEVPSDGNIINENGEIYWQVSGASLVRVVEECTAKDSLGNRVCEYSDEIVGKWELDIDNQQLVFYSGDQNCEISDQLEEPACYSIDNIYDCLVDKVESRDINDLECSSD